MTEKTVDTSDPKWDDTQKVWYYDIPYTTIADMIQLNSAQFKLDSYQEFKAFESAINSLSYGINVWEPAA